MKNFIYFLVLFWAIISCSTSKQTKLDTSTTKNDTIRIANDALEYEILIFDPGFSSWLASKARPRNYYSKSYLEARNEVWVTNWNINVNSNRNNRLFEMSINYDNTIDYGYEVNYLLFNYLTYFQITNNIQLGGFPARI